jgi:hypothetical protein
MKKKFTISEDVEIVANGQRILLEKGDKVIVEIAPPNAETPQHNDIVDKLDDIMSILDIIRQECEVLRVDASGVAQSYCNENDEMMIDEIMGVLRKHGRILD